MKNFSFYRLEKTALLDQLNEFAQNSKMAGGANPIAVLNLVDIVAKDLQKKESPEAYLMYALYDKDSNRYEVGKRVLTRNAANQHEELEEKLAIKKNGYIETFVVNETGQDVWFDNFKVLSQGSILVQETHYDPWGLELKGIGYEYAGVKRNKYLYNGKELIEDNGLQYYDYGARMYDPTIGRWSVVDPLAHMRVSLTPYNFVSNNPIFRIDPTGALDYPIYGKDGTYLGDDRRTGGDLAFIGERDGKGGFKNLTQFTDNHTQFQTSSNIVKQEGTTMEAKEYLWIAHTANNAANASGKSLYSKLMSGYSSVSKSNKTALSIENNSSTAKFARAGVMDVLSGGADPTGGAQFWDGTDFLAWGLSSPNGTPQNKFEEYSAIFIDVMTFNDYEASQKTKWGNSVRYGSKSYNIPADVFSIIKNPSNWGSYKQSTMAGKFGFYYNTGNKGGILNATGTAGESIFWRVD